MLLKRLFVSEFSKFLLKERSGANLCADPEHADQENICKWQSNALVSQVLALLAEFTELGIN